jgi:probable F420-dependent oxidoreductase
MSVRVGVGLGVQTSSSPQRLAALVDCLEALDFDSLWLSERVTSECPDALTALAYAAGRTRRLKLGTSVTVLPGRNPMLLAKQLATLDNLSSGRLLLTFGLGVANKDEQQAFGVGRDERAPLFDEMLPLIRRLWAEDSVDHRGTWFAYEGASVQPFPVQQPLQVWLGGVAQSELSRCGRLGDGWLPSFVTPDDVKRGRSEIESAAEHAGRKIDADHYGALVPYVRDQIPETLANFVRQRRPGVEPADVVAEGFAGLRARLEQFIMAGGSKFVVVPVTEPVNWDDHVAELADTVHPLQT